MNVARSTHRRTVLEMRGQLITRRVSLRRTSSRSRRIGQGLAWLVFDAGGDLFRYRCYWMGGHCDDHLIEQAQVATDRDAVAWAAVRTPRARIRQPDHVTYWAGSGARPDGFSRSWRPPEVVARSVGAPGPATARAA